MGETTTVAEERLDGSVPLWLAVHEAGHVIARLQLVAAWQLNGLDNPSSLDAVRVWIDDGGQPKGVCQMGIQGAALFSLSGNNLGGRTRSRGAYPSYQALRLPDGRRALRDHDAISQARAGHR